MLEKKKSYPHKCKDVKFSKYFLSLYGNCVLQSNESKSAVRLLPILPGMHVIYLYV